MLKVQRHMLTTNRLESFHQTTLRITPKNVLHRRTYDARCHAAVVYHTLGPHKAAQETGERFGYGFSPEASMQLKRLSARKVYHKIRQSNIKYKQARYQSTKRILKIKDDLKEGTSTE